MREWRTKKMKEGYGKWLYERRKLRFDDAERFRKAIEMTIDELQKIRLLEVLNPADIDKVDNHTNNAIDILSTALRESLEAEEALGPHKKEK
jgi:hypothetical protein